MTDGVEHRGSRRQAILVLGMHRSGTSALTGVLVRLGVRPPRSPMPASGDNPAGHWESAELCQFHDRLLRSAGSRWTDWQCFDLDWLDSSSARPFWHEFPTLLEQGFEGASLFVMKDPRVCRIVPFWLRALRDEDIEAKAVIPVRNPHEVASSLEARDGIGKEQSLLLWLRHALDAELYTRRIPRSFTTYDALLRDWRGVARRTSDDLGVRWPNQPAEAEGDIDAFLGSELRHHAALDDSADSGSILADWTSRAYGALRSLAGDGAAAGAPIEILDDVRHELDRGAAAFGPALWQCQQRIGELQIELARLRHDHLPFEGRPWLKHLANAVYFALRTYRLHRDRRLVSRSGLFDANYYLEQNPGVVSSGEDPLSHFVARGWREGYSPSESFDTGYYLGRYPDVAQAGINPVIHFVSAGRREGRLPNEAAERTQGHITRSHPPAAPGVARKTRAR